MKEYLKMADVFEGMVAEGLTVNGPSIHGENHAFYANTKDSRIAVYAAHAINSHDELVQMNNELLAALEAVIEWYDMESDHSIEPDFYKRVAACQVSEDMVREAISKAKGGIA